MVSASLQPPNDSDSLHNTVNSTPVLWEYDALRAEVYESDQIGRKAEN